MCISERVCSCATDAYTCGRVCVLMIRLALHGMWANATLSLHKAIDVAHTHMVLIDTTNAYRYIHAHSYIEDRITECVRACATDAPTCAHVCALVGV